MRAIYFIVMLFPLLGVGQQTGKIDYPYLGISFYVPDGWVGQEAEGAFIMGHNSIPGLIYMTTHEAKTVKEMRIEAENGINETGGTQLLLESKLTDIGGVGLGGQFSGLLEYTPVRAYIIGVVNPFNQGVLIMAVTTPQLFGEVHEATVRKVAESLAFYTPKESPVVKEWSETLKGAKLTYLDSYYSSDATGGYGGYSSREEIVLCSNEQFDFYSNSNLSVDSGSGTSGYGNRSGQGRGKWEVGQDAAGNALLILSFSDGRKNEYSITYSDGQTKLNGYRYYRTYDHGQCY